MTYTVFYQLPFTGTIYTKIPAHSVEQAIKRCQSLSTKKMLIIFVLDENNNQVYKYKKGGA